MSEVDHKCKGKVPTLLICPDIENAHALSTKMQGVTFYSVLVV